VIAVLVTEKPAAMLAFLWKFHPRNCVISCVKLLREMAFLGEYKQKMPSSPYEIRALKYTPGSIFDAK